MTDQPPQPSGAPRRMQQLSLRWQIFLPMLLVALVPLLILAWQSFNDTRNNLRLLAQSQLQNAAALEQKNIRDWLQSRLMDVEYQVRSFQFLPLLEDLSKELQSSGLPAQQFVQTEQWHKVCARHDAAVLAMAATYDFVYDILITDRNADVLYSLAQEEDLGTNLRDGPYASSGLGMVIRQTLTDGTNYLSGIEAYKPSQYETALWISAPLHNREGQQIGALALQLRTDHISAMLNKSGQQQNRYYLLNSAAGFEIGAFSANADSNNEIPARQRFMLTDKNLGKVNRYRSGDGKEVMGIALPIEMLSQHWYLVAEIPLAAIDLSTLEALPNLLIVVAVLIIIVFIAAGLTARFVSAPMARLVSLMENAAGNSQAEISRDDMPSTNIREINALSASLLHMIEARQQLHLTLQDSHRETARALLQMQELKKALDQHAIVVQTDNKGTITYANDLFCDISGYSREELIGQTHRLVRSGNHPPEFYRDMYRTLSNGDVWHGEFCNRAKDGHPYWVRSTIMPQHDDNGRISGYIAIRTDISEQQRMFDELQELHSISSSTDSTTNKINQILRLGCRIFDLPFGMVADSHESGFRIRQIVCPDARIQPGRTFAAAHPKGSLTLAADKPLAFHDKLNGHVIRHPFYPDKKVESYIGVAIRLQGEAAGTVSFSGTEPHRRAFSEYDMKLISLIGSWISKELELDQQRTEVSKQQSLLERMSEMGRIGVWDLNLEDNTLYWSPMTRRLHEVADDYVPNVSTAINFYKEGEHRERISELVSRGMEDGEPWSEELLLVTAKGHEIWVSAQGHAEFRDGRCVRLYGSFQDIDSRVRAQLAARDRSERLQLAAEAAGMGIWEMDLAGQQTTWDERMFALYGRPYTEGQNTVSFDDWKSTLHPADRERVLREFHFALKNHSRLNSEFRILYPNGEERALRELALFIRDKKRQPLRMVGVSYDVTSLKSKEQSLQDSLSLLEATLESTDNGILVTDKDNRVVRWNTQYCHQWRIKDQQLQGRQYTEVVEELLIPQLADPERTRRQVQEVLDMPLQGVFDLIECSDGRVFERTSLPMTIGDQVRGRVWSYRDITLQKQNEIALRDAKVQAEAAARAKSEFLASMSHEIRTPMNGVIGMLDLLRSTPLNTEQHHRIDLASSSANALLGLINDILDFSKIEANKLELEPIPFNLLDMVGDLAENMAQLAQLKNLDLILDTHKVPVCEVVGDSGRLRQIMTNLLGNAIKFTSEGEVQLQLELVENDDNSWQLNGRVTDTGIGIPEEAMMRLFQAFSQVDASTTRRYGGTGLGLAIVRRLCTLMGGDIDVSSEQGKGSCFAFSVKLTKAASSRAAQPPQSVQGTRVLLAEANDTQRISLSRQLSLWGAEVTSCSSAAGTLLHMQEQQPDILLLDMTLPDANGLDLARQLFTGGLCENCRVVLMTPMHFIADPEQLRNDGIQANFPKPVTFNNLLTIFDQAEARPVAMPQTDTANGGQWLLLVEDNEINQMVASELLTAAGYEVDIASSGVDALVKLGDQSAHPPYALVLMDCQMPEMDGFEATRQIRAGTAGELVRRIPIIAMTANAMQGDRERCLEAGMDDYLTKPIRAAEMLASIARWLDQQPETPPVHVYSAAESVAIWDKASAVERLMGDEVLLGRLIGMFTDGFSARLRELDDCLQNADFGELRSIAHSMKGVTGNLGANGLHQVASQLEQAAQEADEGSCRGLINDLRTAGTAFLQAISESD